MQQSRPDLSAAVARAGNAGGAGQVHVPIPVTQLGMSRSYGLGLGRLDGDAIIGGRRMEVPGRVTLTRIALRDLNVCRDGGKRPLVLTGVSLGPQPDAGVP